MGHSIYKMILYSTLSSIGQSDISTGPSNIMLTFPKVERSQLDTDVVSFLHVVGLYLRRYAALIPD